MLMAIHVIGQVTSELTKMLHLGPKLHLHLSLREKAIMKLKKKNTMFRCRTFISIYKGRQQIWTLENLRPHMDFDIVNKYV